MPDPHVRAAPTTGLAFMATLALLLAFASISTDLYLPAMPLIAGQLHARPGNMELTLSAFLVSFSLGQLIWGPVSDRFGRKQPILSGLVLFIAGSIGYGLAQTVWQIIGWRVVQALGACLAPVVARAIVRDRHERDQAARLLSTLQLIMAAAPILGPIIGGQMLLFTTWRSIFWVLALIGGLSMLAVMRLPETLPPGARTELSISATARAYLALPRDWRFMAYALALGSCYVGIYAYIAATPFAYMRYYGVSAQTYGLLFGLAIVCMMPVNAINARLVIRIGSDRLLLAGSAMVGLCALLAAGAGLFGWGGLAGLVGTLLLTISSTALIGANAISGALATQRDRAGAASALIGAIQYGSGIIGSAAIGWLADGKPSNLGWLMLFTSLSVLLFGHISTWSARTARA